VTAPSDGDDPRGDAAGGGEIGLVLVTHGGLATAFLEAMQHIVGPQSAVAAVCIGPDDDVAARRAEILDALNRVDSGRGAVVMTDMFGGTPSNLALSALGRARVEVIAGVNLPMLIKFASVRGSESLAEAVRAVQEAGRKYINVASSFLPDSPGSNGG
jgi:PTS system mannose-specific IIA component